MGVPPLERRGGGNRLLLARCFLLPFRRWSEASREGSPKLGSATPWLSHLLLLLLLPGHGRSHLCVTNRRRGSSFLAAFLGEAPLRSQSGWRAGLFFNATFLTAQCALSPPPRSGRIPVP